MKTLQYSLALVMLFFWVFAGAGTLEEKRKLIEKSYKVNSSTLFSVTNSFGKIHMNTWEKSEIQVKVEIITRGKNEDRAQRIMDKITVEIDEGSSRIAFATVFGSNMNNKNDETFEVNYTINAPAANPIYVENKFGDIFLGNREGDTEIHSGYGNLKTEDITGFLELELSFGDGSIGNTRNSEIEVKYSDLYIASGKVMEMEQKFSEVELDDVESLELESKYGDVEIKKAANIDTDTQFSGFKIGELTGSLYMEASYISDFEIGKLHSSFTKVEIYGKFSSYEINLEDGLKADLEAEFSFAKMSSSSSNVDLYYQVKDGNRSEYKGRIGGGSPGKKILVKSSYGDLRIR